MKAFLLKLGRFLVSETMFLLLLGCMTLDIAIGIAFALGETRPGYVIGWKHLYMFAVLSVAYFYAGVIFAQRKGVKRG
jgi:hypothetical protein